MAFLFKTFSFIRFETLNELKFYASFLFKGKKQKGRWWSCAGGSSVKGSGEVIRASAPYTSGWGSFVLLKMDCVRVARGGSLSTLHRYENFQEQQIRDYLIYTTFT